ncbi:MAG: hypothetical protein J6W52_13425 [Bacteroidaceae bacterium]|nr:hypothetical protein [Bacteroidaceae bacterium]MBO7490800.1 hypothetical protein [Bacteroidales bacterium]
MCINREKQTQNIDKLKASDVDQERYRAFFKIEDRYLIQYRIDETKQEGFIVFLDEEYDIDWVDTRTDYFSDEEEKVKQQWIAKLDAVHMEPCSNISEEDRLIFKKKLAIGYELVMVKCFGDVQAVIEECYRFVKSRNREVSRSLFLVASAPMAIIAIAVIILDIDVIKWHEAWVTGFCTGILGAFVSIWTRYGKKSMTGLSSRWLHIAEALCRLLVGAIFALVAIFAVKCGLLLSNIDVSLMIYTSALIGFVAGFSERFVPSLVEKIAKDESEDDSE